MLQKVLIAIDRFYVVLIGTLLILLLLVVFTFKGMFSAIKTATEIDEQVINPGIGIDIDSLNRAYEVLNERNVSLDLTK